MITRIIDTTKLIVLVFAATVSIHSCNKVPTAAFRIEPTVNPEAGDTIFFINESLDALSYEWDFGNGKKSTEESPFTFFEEAGPQLITLYAMNDAGEDSLSQIFKINEPTIMGFWVLEPDSVTSLVDCNIWVYDNEADWYDYNEPQLIGITDMEGVTIFQNVEALEYYLTIFKQTAEGLYIIEGKTNTLELNKTNLYKVTTEFLPDTQFDPGLKSRFPKVQPFTRSLHSF